MGAPGLELMVGTIMESNKMLSPSTERRGRLYLLWPDRIGSTLSGEGTQRVRFYLRLFVYEMRWQMQSTYPLGLIFQCLFLFIHIYVWVLSVYVCVYLFIFSYFLSHFHPLYHRMIIRKCQINVLPLSDRKHIFRYKNSLRLSGQRLNLSDPSFAIENSISIDCFTPVASDLPTLYSI